MHISQPLKLVAIDRISLQHYPECTPEAVKIVNVERPEVNRHCIE